MKTAALWFLEDGSNARQARRMRSLTRTLKPYILRVTTPSVTLRALELSVRDDRERGRTKKKQCHSEPVSVANGSEATKSSRTHVRELLLCFSLREEEEKLGSTCGDWPGQFVL